MDPLVAAIDQGTSSTRFLVSFSEVSLFSCCVQGPGEQLGQQTTETLSSAQRLWPNSCVRG